ncbi:hypothetical protein [Paenibacillus agricola]|uniref:Uncharacterized protein n=1 Tax=Paenibacillus agricola TaxID=2716264 RepID=A0ABX0JJK8_9BACL|nr:hypothetical protein [Paenibacillus agricola]NHN35551.1 hypothetical protein [Paenibacillus agricola]
MDKEGYYIMIFRGTTKMRLASVLAAIANVLDSEMAPDGKLDMIEIIKNAAITAEADEPEIEYEK